MKSLLIFIVVATIGLTATGLSALGKDFHEELLSDYKHNQTTDDIVRLGIYHRNTPDSLLFYINEAKRRNGATDGSYYLLRALYEGEHAHFKDAAVAISLAEMTIDTSKQSLFSGALRLIRGRVAYVYGAYDASFADYIKAGYIFTDLKEPIYQATAQLGIGMVLFKYSEQTDAQYRFKNVIDIAQEHDNKELYYLANLEMSASKYYQQDYDSCLYYARIAKPFFESRNNNRNFVNLYTTLGYIDIYDDPDKAEVYFKTALENARYSYDSLMPLFELGNCCYNRQNYTCALRYYQTGVNQARIYGFKYYEAYGLRLMAEYYDDEEIDKRKAIAYYDSAAILNCAIGAYRMAIEELDAIIKLYNSLGDNAKVIEYMTVKDATTQLLIGQKEKLLSAMRNDVHRLDVYIKLQKSHHDESVRKSTIIISYLAFASILLVLVAWLYRKQSKYYKECLAMHRDLDAAMTAKDLYYREAMLNGAKLENTNQLIYNASLSDGDRKRLSDMLNDILKTKSE